MPHIVTARFWQAFATSTLLLGAVTGCSHFDPHQHVKPLAQRELPRDPRSTLPPDFPTSGNDENLPDRLTAAMRTAEELRLGLLDHVRQMGDERSAFEASLFTLSPFLLYQAVRSENHGSARRQVLGIGGALTAWSMWLSRRPPEFEAAYVEGAHQIACLLAGSTEYQYTRDELPLTGDLRWSRQLAADIKDYREASTTLVAALREQVPKPPKEVACAVPGSSQCAARRAALGGGGVDPTSGLEGMEKQIAANLAVALQRQRELDRLEGDVRDRMPNRLVSRAQESMQAVERTIRERRPELASVQSTVAQLGKSVDDLRKSVVARAQSSGAATSTAPPEFQPARLPTGSRNWGAPPRSENEKQELRKAALKAEQKLASRLGASPDPQVLRTERAADAKALLDEMKCTASATLTVERSADGELRGSSTALPPRNTGASGR